MATKMVTCIIYYFNMFDIIPYTSAAVAVSALVLQKDSSKIMDDLERIGATDILLFAINNSRM